MFILSILSNLTFFTSIFTLILASGFSFIPDSLHAFPGGEIAVFFVFFAMLFVVFRIVVAGIMRILHEFAGKTETTLDDKILTVISHFLPYLAALTALWVSASAVWPAGTLLGKSFADIYTICFLAFAGLFASSLTDKLLLWYGQEMMPKHGNRAEPPNEKEVFPFVRNIVRIGLLSIFSVFILQRLGFDTTAIITGLGVGGLAVALALQDTLTNFFGGVHLLIDKPFREGDSIKMETVEGKIMQIGWRTTRILTSANTEIIVPNSKLAGSIIENFSMPLPEIVMNQIVGVDYREDVDNVEKIILETMNFVTAKYGHIIPETARIHFESFGDYSLNFRLRYQIPDYSLRFDAQKEVNRELFYAFKKNDILIPFPTRTVYSPPGVTKFRNKAK